MIRNGQGIVGVVVIVVEVVKERGVEALIDVGIEIEKGRIEGKVGIEIGIGIGIEKEIEIAIGIGKETETETEIGIISNILLHFLQMEEDLDMMVVHFLLILIFRVGSQHLDVEVDLGLGLQEDGNKDIELRMMDGMIEVFRMV